MTTVLRAVDIPGVAVFRRGKVRDTYNLGDALLMVASDRISAFDVVSDQLIPDKGRVLTQMSVFWFRRMSDIVANHLVSVDLADLPRSVTGQRDVLDGRFMIVRKAERIDFECVVRGYLAGSAWTEYRDTGVVCGVPLPSGLLESDRLPSPIFTPARKADTGHDENISIDQLRNFVGSDLTERLRQTSLALYAAAERHTRTRGIILADTKFEFGFVDGALTLIDEALTPDSSRFWDAARYVPGGPQASYDKQPVRDWLLAHGWDRNPPMPALPDEVTRQTSERYREAYTRITGMELP